MSIQLLAIIVLSLLLTATLLWAFYLYLQNEWLRYSVVRYLEIINDFMLDGDE